MILIFCIESGRVPLPLFVLWTFHAYFVDFTRLFCGLSLPDYFLDFSRLFCGFPTIILWTFPDYLGTFLTYFENLGP